MKKLLIAALFVALPGCASSGAFYNANLTEVQLAEDNFDLIATGVSGQAEAGYLFGFSGAFMTEMQTIALARIDGEGDLYAEALEDLWSNFEAEHGSAAGRSLALVNVRFDAEALNAIVYTRPRISVRADVIEFND